METKIGYLDERGKSRRLWEMAFPEDSKEFADYYFRDKIRDNRILVKEEDGDILSMLHLNPYRMKVRDRAYSLDYIVGVATRKDRRHEGHMKSLLEKMMEDMYKERVPFTFLMPASEKIYYPFDFRFIFDQPYWKLSPGYEERKIDAGQLDQPASGKLPGAAEVAEWMNRWLEERFDVYTIRSEEYVKRLDAELASEDGSWIFLYKDGKLAGIRCLWGLNEKEQRLLYLSGKNTADADRKKPAIMARLICLEEFASNIRLKHDCGIHTMEVIIGVEDRLIRQNNGSWLWRLGRDGSIIEKISDELPSGTTDGSTVFTPGELIEWLSGYQAGLKRDWMGLVEPLGSIFIDEIV